MKNSDKYDFFDENLRCYCADDDNCGCTYPENMRRYEMYKNLERTAESVVKTETRHIQKDTVCYCSPKDCDCKIDYSETN